jgi:hypothetical protein
MANDFLAFATGVGANVVDQADYAAASYVTEGYSAGIAVSEQLNKTWRQSSFITAALAQYVNNQTGLDVLDDGNLAGFITKLTSAIVVGAGVKPIRTITASSALAILLTDYRLILQRTAGVAALNATLPAGAAHGQSFKLIDVVGNLNADPVTVLPQAGQNIAGRADFVMNIDRMAAEFALCNDGVTWTVEL